MVPRLPPLRPGDDGPPPPMWLLVACAIFLLGVAVSQAWLFWELWTTP